MKKFRFFLYWLGLFFIIALAVFSIIGAFNGADWAKGFFNSMPLSVYWTGFALLIIVSIFAFPRLMKKPGLLGMHGGCVLIIAGSMWGSAGGHSFGKKYFGTNKIQSGNIAIIENSSHDIIYDDMETLYKHYFNNISEGVDEKSLHRLPFDVKLNDFRIEYYENARLAAVTKEAVLASEMFKIGRKIDLGSEFGTITPVKTYNNLKINAEDGKIVGFEGDGPGENPAVEVLVKHPDGREETKYVYEKFPDFNIVDGKFQLKYARIVRDYISELEIVKNGEVVAKKDIEVNAPLHYGGYHFYQSSFQPLDHGMYATILSVTSDSGLYCVFFGYFLLCGGIVWHFWIAGFFTKKITKSTKTLCFL